jgi:hypothetical protein
MLDLKPISALELLQLNAATISELKRRGVIRTKNKPTGDYAEYLFCTAFGWSQEGNSTKSHDAVSHDGTTYQIKARHFSGKKSSRQLGSIRSFEFDYLAAVLFREDYTVERAIIIPVTSIKGRTHRSTHTNSDLLILEDHVWNWPGIQDVTENLRQTQSETKG